MKNDILFTNRPMFEEHLDDKPIGYHKHFMLVPAGKLKEYCEANNIPCRRKLFSTTVWNFVDEKDHQKLLVHFRDN